MCGIIGYIGTREAAPLLYHGLEKLEYRGYDSAGIASITDGRIAMRRTVGKLNNLQQLLRDQPISGTMGIGHTRWATHGAPSEQNAHPHRAGDVVVIHNGIIENYLNLRHELMRKGREFGSETDTEVISHLIDQCLQEGMSFLEATRTAVQHLSGSFAIVAMSEKAPGTILAAKNATPILIS